MITESGTRIALQNIVFLTDFSKSADAALPFAQALASTYGATVHVLHVQTPVFLMGITPESVLETIRAREETSRLGMERLHRQMSGTPHEVHILRDSRVWPALKEAIAACRADLVVLGTHGRTGAEKLLMGSIAEEVFRCAKIPVLTIGPEAATQPCGRFQHILFATDLMSDSDAGLSYAISLAEESQAQLTLLHVLPKRKRQESRVPNQASVATALHALCELVPKDAQTWCRPDAAVEFGEPSERILHAATERNCDLIVLGVRDTGMPRTEAHLEGGIAYQVMSRANCPVLTVRGIPSGSDTHVV